MITETVPESLHGERLDKYLSLLLDCSRSRSATLIVDGEVTVNGVVQTTRSRPVDAGDVVVTAAPKNERPMAPASDASIAVEIVHADEHLIVIDKQPGLVVHPGSGNNDGTLVNGLLARFPELAEVGELHRPGIVHRLDRGTSGLMLVARTPLAYDSLVAALSARRVRRRYLAVAWGTIEADEGLIDAPIGRSQRDPTRMALVADGKDARTRYAVVERIDEPEVTIATCELETGRTHQIRVHLASIGHSVVGDERYGRHRESLPFARPALHAAELHLTHPVNGTAMAFRADPPPDLSTLLNTLRNET